MSRLTDNRNDPGINQPTGPGETNEAYLILSEAERAKGFVRPVRDSYVHASKCGTVTRMARELAETYAREPKFYSHTWCCECRKHCPVEEFVWDRDGQRVGS